MPIEMGCGRLGNLTVDRIGNGWNCRMWMWRVETGSPYPQTGVCIPISFMGECKIIPLLLGQQILEGRVIFPFWLGVLLGCPG